MTTKVGVKGQVVIEQSIRDQLGIEPGMLAVQQCVGDHVEVRFLKGPHRRSLAGAARPFITRYPTPEDRDDLMEATADAWAEGYRQSGEEHGTMATRRKQPST